MDKSLIKNVKEKFIKTFNTNPLLVFSPGRINLIGEHTDYNEGFVFPAAVDKGIALAIQKSTAATSTAYAIDKEETYEFNLADISPLENGGWRNYILGVVSEIKKEGIELGNFNIAFAGDIPGGAGMSSSAALENSVVYGLNKLFDLGLTKHQMIFISQKAEHNFAGVNCGIMDQYASMFGKKDSALLLDCRTLKSKTYKIDFQDYKLMLINTNVTHDLSESAYNDRRLVCEKVAKQLKIEFLRDATEAQLTAIKPLLTEKEYQKVLYVVQENERVQSFSKAIENNDIRALGAYLYQSHDGLSKQYEVSCAELDFLVDATRNNTHILGARMMGGGFGGCTINLIKKTEVKKFSEEISAAYQKQFNKECSIYKVKLSNGTRLIK